MHKEMWISTRDPDSFSDVLMFEVSQRVLLKQIGNGKMETFEPSKMSIDQFKSQLSYIGEVKRFEQYYCTRTGLNVVRGSVFKDEQEYFFTIFHPENDLYEQVAESTLMNLRMSGRMKV